MTCAEALRRLMLAHRLKQMAVAAEAGMCTSSVTYTLQGKMKVRPSMINAVADLTGVDKFHRQELHSMAAREAGWEIGE